MPKLKRKRVNLNSDKSRPVLVEQVIAHALEKQRLAEDQIKNIIELVRPSLTSASAVFESLVNSSTLKLMTETQAQISSIIGPQVKNIINTFNSFLKV